MRIRITNFRLMLDFRKFLVSTVFIAFFITPDPLFGQIITSGTNSGTLGNTGVNLRDPTAAGTPAGLTGGQQGFIALTARGGLKLPEFENVNGSPFLHPEYNTAYVRVNSGYAEQGVSVKFNVYGNEIIFQSKGNEMALDSVNYVAYTTIGKNNQLVVIKLKTGFPPIGTNTRQTIYQLLDSGTNIQLLKYYYQKVQETKSMGTAPVRDFVTYEDLYINTPSGIKKIKGDLSSVKEAMPEYAVQIDKIVNEMKLKLKKESDLILLINELNKVQKAF
jgi:hypothetical protein